MKSDTDGVIDEMVQDSICKTYMPLRDAQRRIIDGREHDFCNVQCADRFEKQKGTRTLLRYKGSVASAFDRW